MKIALMTNNYKPVVAGVPVSIERLARGLEALGHEVTVFAPTYKEMQEQEENVFRYSTCLNHFVGGIVLPNPYDFRIEKAFRENSFDIIHVHHPMLIGRMAVHLSRKYKIPLVFTYHTRYEQYVTCYTRGMIRMNKFMPYYLRGFMKHCDFVFAPTDGMRRYLTDTCRIQPEKTGVLPTGIEKANFDIEPGEGRKIRRQYGAVQIPMLLTVSRMASEKNVKFLLESLAEVKRGFRRPFRMLMVGDGPDREALEKYSRALGLEDTVIFAGAVPNEEIAAYFKAADGFLFASRTETQGIVVLEAFAGGAPVIAVRATGVEDLVEDGVDGILTEEDTSEYAAKVIDFLKGVPAYETDETLPETFLNIRNRKMRENALQKASLFREEAVALKAIHYYNSVIAENAAQQKRNIRLLPAG